MGEGPSEFLTLSFMLVFDRVWKDDSSKIKHLTYRYTGKSLLDFSHISIEPGASKGQSEFEQTCSGNQELPNKRGHIA